MSTTNIITVSERPVSHRVCLDGPVVRKTPRIFEGEMFSCYLDRVATDNCFNNAEELMQARGIETAPDKWHCGPCVRLDCFSPGMFQGFSVPDENMIMAHTTLPAYTPFWSRGFASRYVRQCSSVRHGRGILSRWSNPLVDIVRICPECNRIAAYVHREHNIPGVSVCWRHDCPLSEKMEDQDGQILEKEVKPGPHALKVARFVKAFIDADLRFCLQDLLPVFKDKVKTWEAENRKDFVSHLESMGFTAAAAGVRYTLKYVESCDNEVPCEEMMIALMVLYEGDVATLASEVKTSSSEKKFLKAIEGRFRLDSPYDERAVCLTCMKCGTQFYTTVHSILSGWGCPREDDSLSDEEVFRKLFDYVNDGYELLDSFRDFQHPVTVRHIATGKVLPVMPDRFLNFPHEGLLGKQPLDIGDIRPEVEKSGLVLESVDRREKGTIMLNLLDPICGGRFSESLRSFRRNPACRCCCADARPDLGLDVDESHTRDERAEDTARIKAEIAGFDGVFFLDDIHITDKRFTANLVSRMARGGELRRVDSGAYCTPSVFPSFMDVVDAKYVLRHGERRGFHCGNTFLKDLGLVIDDPVPTVVSMMSDKAFNTQNLKVCGRSVRVIKSHVRVTADNWKALAVLFMLRHLSESDAVDEVVMYEVVSRWMEYEHIGFADIVPFRNEFSARIFNDAVELLRRIA